MHQQLQKREEDNPGPGITKTTSNPWEKMKLTAKIVERKTQENLQLLPKREETEKRECMAEWPAFLGIFPAREVRTRFSKMGLFPIRISLPTLFPFHAITNSTTFWQK